MENKNEDDVQVEIREHSDEYFYPEKCPSCGGQEINRHTYKIRTIQDLGAPNICRRIRYEKITFKSKKCKKNIRHRPSFDAIWKVLHAKHNNLCCI